MLNHDKTMAFLGMVQTAALMGCNEVHDAVFAYAEASNINPECLANTAGELSRQALDFFRSCTTSELMPKWVVFLEAAPPVNINAELEKEVKNV